jgi:four helix bundle protein
MKITNLPPNSGDGPPTQVPPPSPTLDLLEQFDVYRRSLELARLVRAIDVRADLRSQMVRAAESVVLNLAEGVGRSGGDRLRSFQTARGSLFEVAAALDLAGVALGPRPILTAAQAETRAVAAMLSRLTRGR